MSVVGTKTMTAFALSAVINKKTFVKTLEKTIRCKDRHPARAT